MKRRFVYKGGEIVAEYEGVTLVRATPGYLTEKFGESAFVQGDINPYQSMVDGSMIDGRAQHREHLRRHGLVEFGNDLKPVQLGRDAHLSREVVDSRREMLYHLVDKEIHRRKR